MLSKKIQKIGVAGLASILLFGGSVSQVFALNETNINNTVKVQKYHNYRVAKYPSFEDFMKNDVKKKDVSEDDIKELKKLYSKAIDYKKEGEFTEAYDVMKIFYEISNQYEDLYVNNYVNNRINIRVTYPRFEDFMKNDVKKKDVSEEDMSELERLYDIALEFKKDGKYTKANDVMKSFYAISNQYEDLYVSNYVNNRINIRVTYPTFEDFMENDVKKQDISEGDMIELERLYNIAVDYKKEGKFIEANDVMKSFNNIVNEYSDIVIENTNNVEIDI